MRRPQPMQSGEELGGINRFNEREQCIEMRNDPVMTVRWTLENRARARVARDRGMHAARRTEIAVAGDHLPLPAPATSGPRLADKWVAL